MDTIGTSLEKFFTRIRTNLREDDGTPRSLTFHEVLDRRLVKYVGQCDTGSV